MKRVIEVTAKTVDDAINDGLKQLGITMDDADIKVISAGGLFKKAKVEISTGEDEPEALRPVKNEEPKREADKVKPEPKHEEKKEPVKSVKEEPKKQDVKQDTELNKRKFEPKTDLKPSDLPKKTFLKKEVLEANSEKTFVKSEANNEAKKPEQVSGGKFNDRNKDRNKKPYTPKPSVSAPVTDEKRAIATEFLTNLLKHMSIEGDIEIVEDNGMRITVNTSDSAIIGYRGEVLDSIQYLTSLKVNEGADKSHILLSVDALGYRNKRVETLQRLAQKTAEKCIKNNRRVSLEPMNSADRRIIHAELSENDNVITRSEGHEPARRIVVFPKR